MKSRTHFLLLVTSLVLAWSSLTATAQNEAPIVKEIEIQYAGPASFSRERILSNMRTSVGKPYSEQVVEEDIRNLYATGSVNNVRIFGEALPSGVKVVVVVQTKATVSEVGIEGATQIKTRSLQKNLSTKIGAALDEAMVEEDKQKILEAYRNKGYTETTVRSQVDLQERSGKAKVTYIVSEGGKVAIRQVRFEGNEALKEKALRKVVKTKPRNILSPLTKTGRLSNEQMETDLQALKELYQNEGYVDVEVLTPRIEPVEAGRVDVVFVVKEGRQYQVGTVAVQGAQTFSNDELQAVLKSTPGAVFSPKTLRADAKTIQDMYGTRGYVDTQVGAETSSGKDNAINILFRLDEGAQSYVERVNIQGNTRTKDKVIRRELAVAPGEVYDTVKVEASKQRLMNLNYFSRVDTYPSETSIEGRKDLNVLVEEKRTGSFNFGAGFSSIDNLLGFVELTQSNFDITRWPNFTGGGQRFRTRLQYGTKRKDFVMGLTEPWFLDQKLAVGGEVFYREASYVSSVFDQKNVGFDLNARKPLGNFTSVRLNYRLQEITIQDVDDDASQAIKDEEGSRLKSSLTAGINHDTRDSLFLTRKGHRVDFSAFVAGGPLGGETDIYGFNLEGSKYFQLPYDTILLFNAEMATADTWNGGDRVPIFDRLFLGGANDMRGFDYRDVGPKDEDGEPLGGKSLARLTVEYTVPIIDRIRGAVFYDVGFVNAGSYEFSPDDLNSDVGIGVRLDLPIGPVRLDYGIPIQSDEWNDSSGRFNFNIGYQF